MKQKIKIMKNREQLSDEELQSYMNFDHLLATRNAAVRKSKLYSLAKWSIPLLIATVTVCLFYANKTSKASSRKGDIQLGDTALHSFNLTPLVAEDSLSGDNKISNESPQDKVSIPQPTNIEKSTRTQIKEKPPKEDVYIQAEPLNGYTTLYSYFRTNLIYPSEGVKDSIGGVQTISFIISKNGTPEKIEVVNSLGEPFEMEARRLIQSMPPWKPATLNGRPVASKISLPITFQIQRN